MTLREVWDEAERIIEKEGYNKRAINKINQLHIDAFQEFMSCIRIFQMPHVIAVMEVALENLKSNVDEVDMSFAKRIEEVLSVTSMTVNVKRDGDA